MKDAGLYHADTKISPTKSGANNYLLPGIQSDQALERFLSNHDKKIGPSRLADVTKTLGQPFIVRWAMFE